MPLVRYRQQWVQQQRLAQAWWRPWLHPRVSPRRLGQWCLPPQRTDPRHPPHPPSPLVVPGPVQLP